MGLDPPLEEALLVANADTAHMRRNLKPDSVPSIFSWILLVKSSTLGRRERAQKRMIRMLFSASDDSAVKKLAPGLLDYRAYRVPELIPVLGSQPVGDESHKPGGRLPLLSARPAVTPATLKRAATNFAAW